MGGLRFSDVGLALGLIGMSTWVQADPVRSDPPLGPQPPRFQFTVTLHEFSVLNSSALSAVSRYGGEVDFDVNMVRNPQGEVVWNVTVDNPRLIKAWSRWVADKSIELIQSLDTDSLSREGKQALRTIQTLSVKLEQADAQPIWDTVRVAGQWQDSAQELYLKTVHHSYRLTGAAAPAMMESKNRDVVVTGFVKVAGEIEVVGTIPRKLNTLELFTMSQCPYGQAALARILEAIASDSGQVRPRLDVRFIFYRDESTGQFSSLHGESEIQENLVQIVLRDRFPTSFPAYLSTRLGDAKVPWDSLVRQSGLTERQVSDIDRILKSDRQKLIQSEYEYVAGACRVHDGSPAYFWESVRVTDPGQIAALGHLLDTTESCSKTR